MSYEGTDPYTERARERAALERGAQPTNASLAMRANLRKTAEALAAKAAECGASDSAWTAELAQGAKAALEAMALVDADPAPVTAALEDFARRLDAFDWVAPDEPVASLDAVATHVEAWRIEVRTAEAVQHGYLALRTVLNRLLTDFSAAQTETAQRYAARIQTALESAEQAIQQARQEQEG